MTKLKICAALGFESEFPARISGHLNEFGCPDTFLVLSKVSTYGTYQREQTVCTIVWMPSTGKWLLLCGLCNTPENAVKELWARGSNGQMSLQSQCVIRLEFERDWKSVWIARLVKATTGSNRYPDSKPGPTQIFYFATEFRSVLCSSQDVYFELK